MSETAERPREARRLEAIARTRALDRVADPALQGLVRLAAFITGSSSAGIHVLDDRWQHRIAGVGAPLVNEPRPDSFCRLVVEHEQPINVADASLDGRFDYSSAVTGETPVRFYAAVPLRAGGEVIGTVCAFDTETIELPEERLQLLEDVALQATTCIEMANLIDELSEAASMDALTGAANRLILADRLEHYLARQSRHPELQLLVAMIDLDAFKQINDRYGHQCGDAVLRRTAGNLAEAVRAEDTIARIGGDEFVVVAEVDRAALGAEELRSRLEDAIAGDLEWDGVRIRPQATVGVVVAEPGDTGVTLMSRADQAMYERKPPRHASSRPGSGEGARRRGPVP